MCACVAAENRKRKKRIGQKLPNQKEEEDRAPGEFQERVGRMGRRERIT